LIYRKLERRWAYYKVAVMVFKCTLLIPTILLVEEYGESSGVQAGVSLALCSLFAGDYTEWHRPFPSSLQIQKPPFLRLMPCLCNLSRK
jgi:hypothetical protein